jgi:hypothetical protein
MKRISSVVLVALVSVTGFQKPASAFLEELTPVLSPWVKKFHDVTGSFDITKPGWSPCDIANSTSDLAAVAATSGEPYAVAVGSALQVADQFCGGGNGGNKNPISIQAQKEQIIENFAIQLEIEQARQNGKTDRLRILEESKLALENARQTGETDRVRIVQQTALEIALSHDQTQLRLGELNLQAIKENNWTAIQLNQQDNETAKALQNLKGKYKVIETTIKTGGDIAITAIDAATQRKIGKTKAEAEERMANAQNETERLRIQSEERTTNMNLCTASGSSFADCYSLIYK